MISPVRWVKGEGVEEERRGEEWRTVCQGTAAPVIYIDEGTDMAGSFQQFDHSGRVGN